jgi:membrane-associated phospholipid phosphatase
MMRVLSGLADGALLVPAAIVLLLYLFVSGQGAAARLWALVLVACGLATLAFKLLFHACGPTLTELDVVSPSGHASFATAFYGGLAILVGTGRPRWQQIGLGLAVAAFLALVGISRVRTGAHTGEEVVIGLAIGAASVALFWLLHRRIGRPAVSPRPLAIGFAAALVVLGGSHFSLEPLIGGAARRISAVLDVCEPSDQDARRRGGGSYAGLLRIQPWLLPLRR